MVVFRPNSLFNQVKWVAFGSLSVFFISATPPAIAENPMTELFLLSGSCKNIVTYGKLVKLKRGKAMNTLYRDGRSGFYFVAENLILTFSGDGDQKIRTSPDSTTQVIDLVLVNKIEDGNDPNTPDTLPAIGKCSFENPFLGKPTQWRCSAVTKSGDFEATFHHDGSEPLNPLRDGQSTQN
jgi:hypothetical protein